MRLGVSVKRLRWGLLASATLLVVLVIAFLGYEHYSRFWLQTKIEEKIKRGLKNISENVTYSDSVGGKINYTLHADKVEAKAAGNGGDEVYILHGVKLDLYGRTEGG